MSALLGTIPYEHIEGIRSECGGDSCENARLLEFTNMKVYVDVVNTPGNELNDSPGSFVTLETTNEFINGIYKVVRSFNNGPFRTVQIDVTNANVLARKAFKNIAGTGAQGQLYFGKRSGTGEEGGTVTQILNTDIGKAVGAIVLGAVAIILVRYLVK